MHKTEKAYKKWAKGFMEKCEYFDKIDLDMLSDAELLSFYNDIETSGIKHYQLVRYGMVPHSLATNLMIKNWLVEWLDDNKTVEMNIKFPDLAKIVRQDTNLYENINPSADLSSLNEIGVNKLIYSNSNFKKDLIRLLRILDTDQILVKYYIRAGKKIRHMYWKLLNYYLLQI